MARRSVRPHRLVAPGPSESDLQRIANAGARGIDHGSLRPWRLVLVADRDQLANAFAAAHLEQHPETAPAESDRARQRALAGPVVLALIAKVSNHDDMVPAHEQWIAIGAALQQMLLAADALGFAGCILSGRKVQSDALRRAFSLAPSEQLVGFLTFGTAATENPPRIPPTDDIGWTIWSS